MPRSSFPAFAVFALLALLAAAVAWGFWGDSYDDAFITYRYARNWAEHGELAFNPGERVLGTTAPGYALLLGLLSRLSGLPVPAWGTLLSVLSLLAVALVVRLALASEPPLVRDGVPLLFGFTSLLYQWNVEMLGAETFPVLALGAGACFLALARGRQWTAGLLAAGAMVCRSDAALLAGLLGLALWWRERRFPWRFALAGLLPVLPLLVHLRHEFGSVIPNTMAAKRSEAAAVREAYTLQEWGWLRRTLPLYACLDLLGLAAVGLAAGTARAFRRGAVPGPFLVAALWVAGHEAAYRLLGVPFAPWYHVLLVNGLLLLAALGTLELASRTAIAALLVLPLLVPVAVWQRSHYGAPPDPRWPGYAAAGRYVREHGGTSLAAIEIGFLGWEAGPARVLDLMGLVSPEALAAKRRGDLPALVARERPEYLVDATLFREPYLNPILNDPRIAAEYREVASFPDGRDPGLRVRLLGRRDRSLSRL